MNKTNVIAAVFGMLASTNADALLLIVDLINPGGVAVSAGATTGACPAGITCGSGQISFTHSISGSGYTPGSGGISGAALDVHLTDAPGGGSETYQYGIGASQSVPGSNVPSGGGGSTDTVSLTVPSLGDLQADGDITVTIAALTGDFVFSDSTLTVYLDLPQAPDIEQLSEPGSLALLAAAGGLLLATRRRNP